MTLLELINKTATDDIGYNYVSPRTAIAGDAKITTMRLKELVRRMELPPTHKDYIASAGIFAMTKEIFDEARQRLFINDEECFNMHEQSVILLDFVLTALCCKVISLYISRGENLESAVEEFRGFFGKGADCETTLKETRAKFVGFRQAGFGFHIAYYKAAVTKI